MSAEVRLHTHGRAGHVSLARPEALHALTQSMCEAMSDALLGWRDDPAIEAVLIDHAEGRGFCAGGDVALVRRSALEDGGVAGRAFFFAEYRLNHLLFTYPKPVVAFMDGVTMGGGVGISQPAKYRVATENTLFAMPEGAIGLFPDVGAGWYLPRLKGRTGAFMALTGARLDGAECLWAGLATHFLPSERLAEAKARIAEARQKNRIRRAPDSQCRPGDDGCVRRAHQIMLTRSVSTDEPCSRGALEGPPDGGQADGAPHVSLLEGPRVDRVPIANENEQAWFAELDG